MRREDFIKSLFTQFPGSKFEVNDKDRLLVDGTPMAGVFIRKRTFSSSPNVQETINFITGIVQNYINKNLSELKDYKETNIDNSLKSDVLTGPPMADFSGALAKARAEEEILKKVSEDKYKKAVFKYSGTLEELANDIGDLHYESFEKFMGHLAAKLASDAKIDLEKKRTKLSGELFSAVDGVKKAQANIGKAWIISKPHML